MNDARKRVALVTSEGFAHLYEDDHLLVTALADIGIASVPAEDCVLILHSWPVRQQRAVIMMVNGACEVSVQAPPNASAPACSQGKSATVPEAPAPCSPAAL